MADIVNKQVRFGVEALDTKVQSFVAASPWILLLHDGALCPSFMTRLMQLARRIPSVLDVRQCRPSSLNQMSVDLRILYACLRDDLGLQFLNVAHARGMQVQPVSHGEPRGYLDRNTFARRVLSAELERQQAGGYLEHHHRIADYAHLIQAYEATRERSGWIVELGCSGGSSAGALLAYVASRQQERGHPEQAFHFIDAFRDDDSPRSADHALLRERLLAYGQSTAGMTIAVSRADVINDPIPQAMVSEGVRLLHIAVDSYQDVAAALARYAPLIVPGGIMICARTGHTPQRIDAYRALQEFMASENARRFCRLDLDSGQSLLVRSLA